MAFQKHTAYYGIGEFTYGIFFLAVPHKGSDIATLGHPASNILSAVTLQPSNSLTESVKRSSHYSEELNARFEPLKGAYKFYSWIEALPLGTMGMVCPIQLATS